MSACSKFYVFVAWQVAEEKVSCALQLLFLSQLPFLFSTGELLTEQTISKSLDDDPAVDR